MNPIPKRSVLITAVVLSTVLMGAISQNRVAAQRATARKMEDVYLNIKSLRGNRRNC